MIFVQDLVERERERERGSLVERFGAGTNISITLILFHGGKKKSRIVEKTSNPNTVA